jgi:hypothetical protein
MEILELMFGGAGYGAFFMKSHALIKYFDTCYQPEA